MFIFGPSTKTFFAMKPNFSIFFIGIKAIYF